MASVGRGFYEFFAGGGLVRWGLGTRWDCLFANDLCPKKAATYRSNFGASPELLVKDVAKVELAELPGRPFLSWASFPCQDLSLAGDRGGLSAERSGTFWPFWELMEGLSASGRQPPMIVLENVVGAITSNGGRDFKAIMEALVMAGYQVGPLVIDAIRFVPQSRPRLFVVAARGDLEAATELVQSVPSDLWHPKALRAAHSAMPPRVKDAWVWWSLPHPTVKRRTLTDLIEENPTGVAWHSAAETKRLLGQMSDTNQRKLREAQALGTKIVGTVYKRTRHDDEGQKVQRAEARFDQISGCLRTPAGGSSRQLILHVEGKQIRSRLLSAREAARLMGAPDSYRLPTNYNEAYHLMGDAVVIPVVSWLDRKLLTPLAHALDGFRKAA